MKEFNFEKELLGVQDELFRFAYKLTADREKAEDLLQDTLLKAMLHKESYNKNTNFKGWLFIIMRNTFINGYRAEVGHTRLYISSDPAYYSRIMDESRTEEVDRTMTWKRYVMPSKVYRSRISYLLRCTCQGSNTVR
jgi:RNA polymerase sigma-70 factor (ECF subfamily)